MSNNNIFSTQYPSGIVFVGSIIVGVGVGMLIHKIAACSLIGIGTGFVLAGVLSLLTKNKFLNR